MSASVTLSPDSLRLGHLNHPQNQLEKTLPRTILGTRTCKPFHAEASTVSCSSKPPRHSSPDFFKSSTTNRRNTEHRVLTHLFLHKSIPHHKLMDSKTRLTRPSPRFLSGARPSIASAHSLAGPPVNPDGTPDLRFGLRSRDHRPSTTSQRLHIHPPTRGPPPTFVINNNGGHINMGSMLSASPAPLAPLAAPSAP
jgi:hypothetical protein